MSERLNLGIDFGTSNSCVGMAKDGKVKLFRVHDDRFTQPSSIFIRADGYHSTGYTAIENFLDSTKKTDTYHFIPTVKPGLPLEYFEGSSLRSAKLHDGRYPVRFFPIEDLASYVLSDLKQKAEKQSGASSGNVVLGRPVVFSDDAELDLLAQSRLKEAAEIAGFKNIRFVLEPVAAALYYERTRLGDKPKKVFVFDFGGGTLDTCVLELRPNEKLDMERLKGRILASHGIGLGGTDLDKDVFESLFLDYFGQKVTFGTQRLRMPYHIYANLPEWHLSKQSDNVDIMEFLVRVANDPLASDKDSITRLITLIRDQQVFALLQAIEKTKIEVSKRDSATIEHHYKNIDARRLLSKGDFERIIISRTRQMEECIQECLKRASMRASDVDLVLRVGGSSSNPFVGKLLQRIFAKVEETEPLTSVVAGLSLAADSIFG